MDVGDQVTKLRNEIPAESAWEKAPWQELARKRAKAAGTEVTGCREVDEGSAPQGPVSSKESCFIP